MKRGKHPLALMSKKENIFPLILFLLAFSLRVITIHLGANADEGSWVVILWKMVSGKILYKDLEVGKTPLLFFWGYPIFKLFNNNFLILRLSMVLLASSIVYPLFKIGQSLGGFWAGIVSALTFALDPMSIPWAKFFHCSPFVVPFEVWGFWLVLKSFRDKKHSLFFLSGIFSALAFLAKQPGIILFLTFFVIFLFHFLNEKDRTHQLKNYFLRLSWFLAGFIVAALPFFFYFIKNKALDDFLYSTLLIYGKFGKSSREAIYLVNPWVEKSVVIARFASLNLLAFLLALFSLYFFFKKRSLILLFIYFWLLGFFVYFYFILHDSWLHHLLGIMPLICLLAGHSFSLLTDSLVKFTTKKRGKDIVWFLIFLLFTLFSLLLVQKVQKLIFLREVFFRNLIIYVPFIGGLIIFSRFLFTKIKAQAYLSKLTVFFALVVSFGWLTVFNYFINPQLPKRIWPFETEHIGIFPGATIDDGKQVGRFLAENSSPQDTLLIFGDPIFSFWAKRDVTKAIIRNKLKISPFVPIVLVEMDYFSKEERQALIAYYQRKSPKLAMVSAYYFNNLFEKEQNKDIANFILSNYKKISPPSKMEKSNPFYQHFKIYKLKD